MCNDHELRCFLLPIPFAAEQFPPTDASVPCASQACICSEGSATNSRGSCRSPDSTDPFHSRHTAPGMLKRARSGTATPTPRDTAPSPRGTATRTPRETAQSLPVPGVINVLQERHSDTDTTRHCSVRAAQLTVNHESRKREGDP